MAPLLATVLLSRFSSGVLPQQAPFEAKRAELEAAEKLVEALCRQLEAALLEAHLWQFSTFLLLYLSQALFEARPGHCGKSRRRAALPTGGGAAGGVLVQISFGFQNHCVKGLHAYMQGLFEAKRTEPRSQRSWWKICAVRWRPLMGSVPLWPFSTVSLLFFTKSSAFRFLSQALFEAKCADLEASEKLVEDLRCRLEAALLEARAKRDEAIAAKRKFEASRRGVEAEMSAVREKV